MPEHNQDNVSIHEIRTYLVNLKMFYEKIFSFCFNAIKKYWIIILAGMILGAAIAGYKYQTFKPYFEAKASFSFAVFQKKLFGEMADKLRTLVRSGSYKMMAEKLNMSENDARKIFDIEALNISGSQLSEDITEGKQIFYVNVKLKYRQVADSLPARLENYFNSNTQAKVQMENNLQKMKERLAFVNSEMYKLDSLKTAYRFYLSNQAANTSNTINNFNPVDLFTASEKLYNKKVDLEWSIINYKVVKILDPFVLKDFPETFSLASILTKYICLGLLISVLLSLILHTIKTI